MNSSCTYLENFKSLNFVLTLSCQTDSVTKEVFSNHIATKWYIRNMRCSKWLKDTKIFGLEKVGRHFESETCYAYMHFHFLYSIIYIC